MRAGPLLRRFSLLLSPLSMFASLGLLIASNGTPVAEWQIQPAACLAIFTAIANQGMRYAALQGVAMAWWSRVLTGRTIAQLHRDWDVGNSIWSALVAGHRAFPRLGMHYVYPRRGRWSIVTESKHSSLCSNIESVYST